jgi:hypothetical protein
MNSKQWTVLLVVLGLIAGTAQLLRRVGASHRLGSPGLRLVNEPTLIAEGGVAQPESVFLPANVLDLVSRAEPVSRKEVDWLPKDTLFGRRLYQAKDGFAALASVVLMGTDRTSIHQPQYCLTSQQWQIDKTETVSIPISRPYPYELKVIKLTASKAGVLEGRPVVSRGLYLYWFVADNQLTPYHGERMWWMARDLIRTGVLKRWAYVTYFTVCWPGQDDVYFSRMKELVARSVPEFQLAAGAPVATAGHSGKSETQVPNTEISPKSDSRAASQVASIFERSSRGTTAAAFPNVNKTGN